MKFSNILLLAFGSFTLADPSVSSSEKTALAVRGQSLIEQRQSGGGTVVPTVVQIITGLVNSLNKAIPVLNDTIGDVAGNATKIPEAVVAALKPLLENIEDSLTTGTDSLLGVVSGSILDIIFLLLGLTNTQLQALAKALPQLNAALDSLTNVLHLTVTNLSPDVVALLQGLINSIQTAIPLFVSPLVNFLAAVSSVGVTLGLNVKALISGISGLFDVVDTLVNTLGLDSLLSGVVSILSALLSIGAQPT